MGAPRIGSSVITHSHILPLTIFISIILEAGCCCHGGDGCSLFSVTGDPGSDRYGMCPLQRKGGGKGPWREKALALNDLPLLKTHKGEATSQFAG